MARVDVSSKGAASGAIPALLTGAAMCGAPPLVLAAFSFLIFLRLAISRDPFAISAKPGHAGLEDGPWSAAGTHGASGGRGFRIAAEPLFFPDQRGPGWRDPFLPSPVLLLPLPFRLFHD